MAVNLYNFYPNHRLRFCGTDNAEKPAEKSLARGKISLREISETLLTTLGLRHSRTMAHSYGVAFYSEAFAKNLGFNKNQQEIIKTAALFHDIGKIYCSDNFFNKTRETGRSDKYKMHPRIAETLLSKINLFKKTEIPQIVSQHHEHEDGTGFPKGLHGDEIRIESKIINLADTFDSITKSKYLFAHSSSPREAVEQMRKDAGNKFDPELLEKFIKFVSKNNFKIVDEIHSEVSRYSKKFSAEMAIPVPPLPPVEKRWLISEKNYIESLAKGVGCEPQHLKAVIGPRELRNRILNSAPKNFSAANAETGDFNINLHLHTTASDGKFTPETLFQEVDKQVANIRKNEKKEDFIVAITDHDTLQGAKQALTYIASETEKNPDRFKGIRFVPGIEINAKYENPEILTGPLRLEVLVYCVNPYEGDLYEMVKTKKEKHTDLINSVIKKAAEEYKIDTSDFEEFRQKNFELKIAGSGGIDNKLVRYLQAKGLEKAQAKELLKDKFIDTNISVYTPSIREILKNSKGAMASIAHPVRINFNNSLKPGVTAKEALLKIFRDFRSKGGYATEANYQLSPRVSKYIKLSPGETLEQRERIIREKSQKTGLLKAGGIDNHGANLLAGE